VNIAAGCTRFQFHYIGNFPTTVANGLTDNGTATDIRSFGTGPLDESIDYHSTFQLFANNTNIMWKDSGGTARNVLGMDNSDHVNLRDSAGAMALRVTSTLENQQYNPIVFSTKTQQLTANTNFTRNEGNIFFLTTNGSGYQFNPTGTFITGAMVIIFNLDGIQTITFDNAGLALAISAGKIALCAWDGSNWKGALIN